MGRFSLERSFVCIAENTNEGGPGYEIIIGSFWQMYAVKLHLMKNKNVEKQTK